MIEEITILSGKGGTGKTSITAALASLAKKAVITDCDVDAADLHLLLQPDMREKTVFEGAWVPDINQGRCTACGVCRDVCRFNAISQTADNRFRIDPFQCEGCRLCENICPEKAITSERSTNNFQYVSETRYGMMVHACMGPGEENSGKLVTAVRNRAREIAKQNHIPLILNDGPPGIGCPVIASLTGVHKVLLVVEPSKSGLHDILRLGELLKKFGIPGYAIINKYDLNPEMTAKALKILKEMKIPLLGKISFDDNFTAAMIQGKTLTEFAPGSENTSVIKQVWEGLLATQKKQNMPV